MKLLTTVCLLLIYLVMSVTSVSASGLTTSSTASGQVMVRNEDGVMYLSTETINQTDENGSTLSTRTRTSGFGPLSNIIIQLPEGFASDFGGLLNGVLSFVMVIAALLVFLYLILGGIQWITSGGDKGKTEAARNKITAAVIGLIIIAASFAILTLALNFLGFRNLNDVFDSAGTIRGGAASNDPNQTDLGEIIEATPSAVPDTN